MSKSGCSKVVATEAKKYVVQKVLVYEPLVVDNRWGPNMKMSDRACQIEQMKRSCMPKLCDCPQHKSKRSILLNEICFGAKIVAFLTLLKISIDAGIFGNQIQTNRLVDSVRINMKKMAEEKEDSKAEDEKEDHEKGKGEPKKGKEEPKQKKEEPKQKKEEPKQRKEEPKVRKEEPKQRKEEPKQRKEEPKTTTSIKEKEQKTKPKEENKKEKEPKKVKSENIEYETEWTLATVWNTIVVRIVKAILDFGAEEKVTSEKPPLKQ